MENSYNPCYDAWFTKNCQIHWTYNITTYDVEQIMKEL